ncbi:oxidase [Vibrio hannami]|uniref:oxidase n=1 Tax=Vibrio hannami TaxID=2717094 RepID=UPI00240FAA38|nr:oxidase [Vibrio hannami]MDG3084629.1 oxidase [Vibrio hannami]
MSFITLAFQQTFNWPKIIRYILCAAIPATLFYGFSFSTLSNEGFETIEIVRDPLQQLDASSFLGFLSNIGSWIWVSSVAICYFTAFNVGSNFDKNRKELLILVGMLLSVIAVDDFFLIHDRYINENICYAVYAVCGGLLMLRQFKTILEIDGFAFMCAGGFLAASIATDVVTWHLETHLHLTYDAIQIMEEGFKFVGAASWLYFSTRIASDSLNLKSKQ